MRHAARSRRIALATLTAALTAAGLLAVDVPGAAAATRTSSTKIAAGVTLNHQTYSKSGHAQSVYWVTVAMGPHAALQTATPRNLMGAKALTTLAMAKQEKAIAGLNGDTFYFDNSPKGKAYNPSLGPRGGIMRNGSLVKAPLQDQNAVFAVTSSGKAYIGSVGYAGAFVSSGGGGSKKLASVNSVESAWNGNITLADNRLLDHSMPSCSEALLTAVTGKAGQFRVSHLYRGVKTYKRIAANQRALLSCNKGSQGSKNATYFGKYLTPGRTVKTSISFRSKGLRSLISGTYQLVRGGKAFTDSKSHGALTEFKDKQGPKSFACVYRNRTSVSLGVFEGGRSGATGVTFGEEAAWLVSRGCYEAMALDVSTSATLVAQRPGTALATINRPTANYPGGMRPQVDGIFVVKH